MLHVSGWEKRGGTALASQRKNGRKVFSVKATTRPRYLSGESSSSVRRGESWLEKSILTGDPRCTMEEEFATGGEIRGGERAASPSLRPLGCLNEIQRAALSPSPVYCERLLIAPFVPLIYDESRVALVIRLAARCLVLNGRARSLQPSNNELCHNLRSALLPSRELRWTVQRYPPLPEVGPA